MFNKFKQKKICRIRDEINIAYLNNIITIEEYDLLITRACSGKHLNLCKAYIKISESIKKEEVK